MFRSQIVKLLRDRAAETSVAGVIIGPRYTAVELEDGHVGIAMNFANSPTPEPMGAWGCRPCDHRPHGDGQPEINSSQATDTARFRNPRWPQGTSAQSLLSLYTSTHTSLESSVGVACANALVNEAAGKDGIEGHFLDHLNLEQSDVVGMVGNFRPVIARIGDGVHRIHVFELIQEAEGDLLPTHLAPSLLPRCSVVIITGTTMVNGTLADLLVHCNNAREVILVGPTTTLLPQAYKGSGLTMISGAYPSQPAKVLQTIAAGLGGHNCLPFMKKINLRIPQ